MRRFVILIIIAVFILLVGCSIIKDLSQGIGANTTEEISQSSSEALPEGVDSEYLKAVWISQFELSMASDADKSEAAFRSKISKMLQNCADNSVNTVIVQVRPFSDAFYPSSIFPATQFLSGTQGVYVGYDALGILVETAKPLGLSVQAWINPYRISKEKDFSALSADNPAKMWYDNDKNTRDLIICDKGIYFNPASLKAQKLIIDGVREIVANYDIGAIHFDDYFYPTKEAQIDAPDYEKYKSSGGVLSLDEWRRANVSGLVSGVYSAIKSLKSDVAFGISCSANLEKNFNDLYADVYEWSRNEGYVDYLMPQIYFGYENESMPFTKTATAWSNLISEKSKVDLYCGIAAYKVGIEDKNAGTGKNEWLQNSNILARQLTDLKAMPAYKGFSFFSYSYIFEDNLSAAAQKELNNLIDVI
ncbi:MAG: hypothetical protein BWY46_00507 [Firmicutes bacterium ADurb.Bin300]|nr:MAG: hypothetical protein BWY46_00507 [Firmicutes bacterium ADurb.Bin300]